ncbi:MAG TPA: DUF4178 domain-containing protein [Verrucomicrobiae bacterium]|jgi:hypothetical protein
MSFANPTQLRLGMTGSFFDRNYRIVGRAVLGIIEGGEHYYWNEFYLENSGGASATLVFEETIDGSAWRLFTMTVPQTSITAEEAAAKHSGDAVELDGGWYHITRVDRSEVYYVEGRAPEGIARGKTANYFNAGSGLRQIAVSWTGEEVEYYSGTDTPALMVASAFGLEGFAAWRFTASKGRSWFHYQIWMPAVLAIALIAIPAGCFIDLTRSRARPAVTYTKAPPAPLRVGASGELNGVVYTITGHELLDAAEQGRRWKRQQYNLADPDHNQASLLCDAEPAGPRWILCPRLRPDDAMTPAEAGGKRAGQTIQVNGNTVLVRRLFRFATASAEGDSPFAGVYYGFSGPLGSNGTLLVRWNATNIIYEETTPVPDKTVLTAFGIQNAAGH